MKDVLISVVIPVFNTPLEALQRCIHSILKQRFSNFEIIVVDDGSNAECSACLKILCSQDKRIALYRKENGGVSSARNYGIGKANGMYIAFVDADDEITEGFFADAVRALEDEAFDIVIGNIVYVDEKGRAIDRLNGECLTEKTIFRNSQIVHLKKAIMSIPDQEYDTIVTALGSPCGKLYKASVAKRHLFHTGLSFGEDVLFNRDIFNDCDSIVIVPDIWYTYYQNDFSAMHRYELEVYIEKWKDFFQERHKIDLIDTDAVIAENSWYFTIGFFYSVCYRILENDDDKENFKKRVGKLLEDTLFTTLFDAVKTRNVSGRINKIKFLFMKYKLTGLIYIYYKKKYFKGNIH